MLRQTMNAETLLAAFEAELAAHSTKSIHHLAIGGGESMKLKRSDLLSKFCSMRCATTLSSRFASRARGGFR